MVESGFWKARYRFRIVPTVLLAGLLSGVPGVAGADLSKWYDEAFSGLSGPGDRVLLAEKGKRIQAVESARVSFETARAAGAEYAAPFEYFMAEEYLTIAEEELNEGDRHGVFDFAEKSERFSELALRKTAGGTR